MTLVLSPREELLQTASSGCRLYKSAHTSSPIHLQSDLKLGTLFFLFKREKDANSCVMEKNKKHNKCERMSGAALHQRQFVQRI